MGRVLILQHPTRARENPQTHSSLPPPSLYFRVIHVAVFVLTGDFVFNDFSFDTLGASNSKRKFLSIKVALFCVKSNIFMSFFRVVMFAGYEWFTIELFVLIVSQGYASFLFITRRNSLEEFEFKVRFWKSLRIRMENRKCYMEISRDWNRLVENETCRAARTFSHVSDKIRWYGKGKLFRECS